MDRRISSHVSVNHVTNDLCVSLACQIGRNMIQMNVKVCGAAAL